MKRSPSKTRFFLSFLFRRERVGEKSREYEGRVCDIKSKLKPVWWKKLGLESDKEPKLSVSARPVVEELSC